MASHGIPRQTSSGQKSVEAREKELRDITNYQRLIELVNEKVAEGDFTPELLQKTTELLTINPEFYTVWNHRRRIYTGEFQSLNTSAGEGSLKEDDRQSQVLDIIQLDLQFLFPLLKRYPKCYWIWNHRLWLLEQATSQLPFTTARRLWDEELGLVGMMLARDSRNFLGWGYRRTVVDRLESNALNGQSMARKEFDYTTKMVESNLSNFSAWHNRTKLIQRILDEQSATDEERRQMLDDELKLIHKALFDPYDQSLWFYHQSLMCTFDPQLAEQTLAPKLDKADRLQYLKNEETFIEELLEDAEDCKWVYQALIECTLLVAKNEGTLSVEASGKVRPWLAELQKLDPLRKGRWLDLEKSIAGGG